LAREPSPFCQRAAENDWNLYFLAFHLRQKIENARKGVRERERERERKREKEKRIGI
jgi:hypothetical protein